ncbi:MAG: CoA-binding protein [Smithella sp.]|nr:CoA-binding protein [Smithella sp.]MDM7985851.1 CoA-binding protein [Smithella sp.]HOU50570.1 CoA-binding protein [Smithella sp.]HQH17545.1 CoA-binding protein [Smithella sp.]HQI72219.1 CoA-binding protein [Smithella sp.]
MLDYFFNPKSVAIIGASNNVNKGGYHIIKNITAGFKGKIYPVNKSYTEILQLPCYPDIASIPGNIDLAIYFIPSRELPHTVNECAKKGVKGIIIESGGFNEAGEEGRRIQKRALENAAKAGIRLWGPNCMGFIDGNRTHVFSFIHSAVWPDVLRGGSVGLIVQSGMLSAGFLLHALQEGVMGVSKACSIGNKCDINENDLLEYMIHDRETEVIACYLESLVDGRKFINLAKKTKKPIIVLMGGRSVHGAKAAQSHTASLSGNYQIATAAFRQAGIIEVFDPAELTDMARAFSKKMPFHPQAQKGTAILTFSGGAGTITVDLMDDCGLRLAKLSDDTLADIAQLFPVWNKPDHPLDLWIAIEQHGFEKVFRRSLNAVFNDPAVDSIIFHSYATPLITQDFFNELNDLVRKHAKPVVLWIEGRKDFAEYLRGIAENAGLPAFREMNRCVSVLKGMKQHFTKKPAG